MKLLFIRGTVDPRNGGPVAALQHLTGALQSLGHVCEVVTMDAPFSPGIESFPCLVHAMGPSLGRYSYNSRLIPWIIRNARNYDVVIVSGIWRFISFAVWFASKVTKFPYYVIVHGALDPWFKRTFPLKHVKKWLYWQLIESQVLKDARAALFTSAEERQLAEQTFNLDRINSVVVNYGTGGPSGDPDKQRDLFLATYPALQGKRIILFLSRLYPNKGCDMLIEAFARFAYDKTNLHLVMAGPDQANWQVTLEQMASLAGISGRVTWTGMLTGDLKWGAFRSAEVFILPSHAESFGIVVAEAMACSLPVLITDKVNIWREIKDDHAGIIETDTVDGVVRLLEKWFALSSDERQEMRANSQDCFLRRFEIKMVAEKLIAVLDESSE